MGADQNGGRRITGRWAEVLQRPFEPESVSKKPQPWCRACVDAKGHCAEHVKKACKACGQRITEAHVDLDYVGHADVTMRLNEADPDWHWEPLYVDVDPELIKLAMTLPDALEIIRELMRNAPPRLDRDGGMWIRLIIHDDDGAPHAKRGYGDAMRKQGPNATKELIGDAIRNAAMRFGVATLQWSKNDRMEHQPVEAELTGPAKPRQVEGKATAQSPDGEAVSPQAQAYADLAWRVMADESRGEEALLEMVQKPAQKQRMLSQFARHPGSGELRRLSVIILDARKAVSDRAAGAPGQEEYQ